MIQLVCSNCEASFQIDDGFAGGVCRCSACGTIQTVPTKEQIASGQTDRAGSVIFKRETASTETSKTLEQLSDVVSSSGLVGSTGSGLNNRINPRSSSPRATSLQQPRTVDRVESKSLNPKYLAAGAFVAVALIALIYGVVSSRPGKAPATSDQPDANPAAPDAITAAPRFGDIPLASSTSVIFLVDRGDATRELLPDIKRLIERDLTTLGPTRRFQIIFWAQDGQPLAIPATLLPATAVNLGAISNPLDEASVGRSTDLMPALAAALLQSPSDLVVITAKGWQMDEDFAHAVLSARGQSVVRIHVVSLGDDSAPLRNIAETTGAAYRVYSAERFRQLARGK